jgi:hypothetical protein
MIGRNRAVARSGGATSSKKAFGFPFGRDEFTEDFTRGGERKIEHRAVVVRKRRPKILPVVLGVGETLFDPVQAIENSLFFTHQFADSFESALVEHSSLGARKVEQGGVTRLFLAKQFEQMSQFMARHGVPLSRRIDHLVNRPPLCRTPVVLSRRGRVLEFATIDGVRDLPDGVNNQFQFAFFRTEHRMMQDEQSLPEH